MSVTLRGYVEISQQIKEIIVERLGLKIKPEEIKDEEALFGEGLALDSVEALEIVVGLEESFGIRIPDEDTTEEFYSVKTLSNFVMKLIEEQEMEIK